MQKRNVKQIQFKKVQLDYKFKNANAENVFGHPLDSHLGSVQDMQSRLPGFHSFRFLNSPHMQYVQEWVSVRFGFLSPYQHLNGHIDFQERVGGWHSPPAQVPNAAFWESGVPFPWGWPSRGPICFVFSLLFFGCCFCFFLLFCVFLFFTSFFCDFFQKVSSFGSPNSDRGPTLSAGHLSGVSLNIARSSSASRVRLGPHFSSWMFPFVFCAGFTTLSWLICCFHVCCIWHFPLSLAAFHLSIFSTYHVASLQLALVPSMCSSFVKCAPFQVAFALSIFPPFAMFASFQLAFCFPIFSAIVMCASFRFACSKSIFACIVSPFVQDVNILEQAQFDSTHICIIYIYILISPSIHPSIRIPMGRPHPSQPKLLSKICCRKPMACLQLLWRRQAAMRAVKSAPRVNCGRLQAAGRSDALMNNIWTIWLQMAWPKTKMVSSWNTEEQFMRVCDAEMLWVVWFFLF